MELRICDRKTCRLHGGAECEFLYGNSCLLSKQREDALIYAFIYSYSYLRTLQGVCSRDGEGQTIFSEVVPLFPKSHRDMVRAAVISIS